jgi:hypothetical protein
VNVKVATGLLVVAGAGGIPGPAVMVGTSGGTESSVYAIAPEHADVLPAASVMRPAMDVVVFSGTVATIPGLARVAAVPLPIAEPAQVVLAYNVTVEPASADPSTFGVLSFEGKSGFVDVSDGGFAIVSFVTVVVAVAASPLSLTHTRIVFTPSTSDAAAIALPTLMPDVKLPLSTTLPVAQSVPPTRTEYEPVPSSDVAVHETVVDDIAALTTPGDGVGFCVNDTAAAALPASANMPATAASATPMRLTPDLPDRPLRTTGPPAPWAAARALPPPPFSHRSR